VLNTTISDPFCPKFTYFASILLIAFADLFSCLQFFQFFFRQNRRTPKGVPAMMPPYKVKISEAVAGIPL